MADVVGQLGSYAKEDVTFLLKDLSDISIEKSTEERERSIQSGTHYSEMLPIEYKPTDEYMQLFYASLEDSKQRLRWRRALSRSKFSLGAGRIPCCAVWQERARPSVF